MELRRAYTLRGLVILGGTHNQTVLKSVSKQTIDFSHKLSCWARSATVSTKHEQVKAWTTLRKSKQTTQQCWSMFKFTGFFKLQNIIKNQIHFNTSHSQGSYSCIWVGGFVTPAMYFLFTGTLDGPMTGGLISKSLQYLQSSLVLVLSSKQKISNDSIKGYQGSKLSRALWWRDGKRKESLQLLLWNLNICIKKSIRNAEG